MTLNLEAPVDVALVAAPVETARADARHAYVLCRGELAECTCPDFCERDHDND